MAITRKKLLNKWIELEKKFIVKTINGTLKHGFNKPEIDSFCIFYTKDDKDKLLEICELYYMHYNKDVYIYFKGGFAWATWNSKHKRSFTRPSFRK